VPLLLLFGCIDVRLLVRRSVCIAILVYSTNDIGSDGADDRIAVELEPNDGDCIARMIFATRSLHHCCCCIEMTSSSLTTRYEKAMMLINKGIAQRLWKCGMCEMLMCILLTQPTKPMDFFSFFNPQPLTLILELIMILHFCCIVRRWRFWCLCEKRFHRLRHSPTHWKKSWCYGCKGI
jgi:hypothetical protein